MAFIHEPSGPSDFRRNVIYLLHQFKNFCFTKTYFNIYLSPLFSSQTRSVSCTARVSGKGYLQIVSLVKLSGPFSELIQLPRISEGNVHAPCDQAAKRSKLKLSQHQIQVKLLHLIYVTYLIHVRDITFTSFNHLPVTLQALLAVHYRRKQRCKLLNMF